MKELYPLKFHPLLKEKVWGGHKLNTLFGKEGEGHIGESWEISGVEGNVSVVSNGVLKGNSLTDLIQIFGSDLLGEKVVANYGDEFPLLFKFIDASQDLSVQLHPNDAVAKERHNSFGKTEMWYIMDAEEEARLILGFNGEIHKEAYMSCLAEGKITSILHEEPIKAGDAFFIAPGTVHAIGAGIVLAEIQQTSDITYRIYDWDRPGMDGQKRELHTHLALDVINFEDSKPKLHFSEEENTVNDIHTSAYFDTKILPLSKSMVRNLGSIDSFVVYMCTDGEAQLEALGTTERITKGETLLIPALANEVGIKTTGVTLLEVTVP